MGGHQAGEVASQSASRTLSATFTTLSKGLEQDPALSLGRALPTSGDLLVRGIRLANRTIHTLSETNQGMSGMGTTIVAIALENDMMSIAHVGDSRAYKIDEKQLTPLTIDHSWVSEMQQQHQLTREEASSVVGKNIITRALGVKQTVEVDYRLIKVRAGDLFLLCSDGLCGYADDDEIFDAVKHHRENIDKMSDQLVQMANERGGSDNVSVIIVKITEAPESAIPELAAFTLPAESPETLQAEDLWIERMTQLDEQDTAEETGSAKPKTLLLGVIFVLFIAAAAAIIYFSAGAK
jgi:protein phosphatase